MTIGLICAIPQELSHLRAVLAHGWSEEIAHARFAKGGLDGYEVVLVGGGIGKVNTALTATVLADRFRCRMIVLSGVAGGLDPDLAIGDVVIADRTLQHDAGVIEDERLAPYQAGHVPFFNPTDRMGYFVDPELLTRVEPTLRACRLIPCHRRLEAKGARRGSLSARSSRAISTSIARPRASASSGRMPAWRSRWRVAP
jgi:adenosylhomocysteine nucleosidase